MAHILQYIKDMMRKYSKICGNENGFSLTELLVVVALIAIIGAISVPMLMSQRPKWHLKGVSKDLASKLMMARLKAIQNNKTYSVVVSTSGVDSFAIYQYDNVASTWSALGGSYVGMSDVSIAVNTSCITSSRIPFYPDGKALWADTSGKPGGCAADATVNSRYLVATLTESSGRFGSIKIYVYPMTGIIRIV